MSRAQKCPICKGSGKIRKDGEPAKLDELVTKTCHGCDGKGWVIVPTSYPTMNDVIKKR